MSTERQPLLNLQEEEDNQHSAPVIKTAAAATVKKKKKILRNPIPTVADLDRLAAEDFTSRRPNAEDEAGIFSSLTYSWFSPVITQAIASELPRGEIVPVAKDDGTTAVAARFWHEFEKELEKESSWNRFIPSLWQRTRKTVEEEEEEEPASAQPYVPVTRRSDGAKGTLLWVGKLLQDEHEKSPTRVTIESASSTIRGAVHWRTRRPLAEQFDYGSVEQKNNGGGGEESNSTKSTAAAAASAPGAGGEPPELVVVDKKVNGEDLVGMLDPRPQDGGDLITAVSVESLLLDVDEAAKYPTPTKASVWWALVRSLGALFFQALLPRFLAEAALLLSPYLLELYTAYLHDKDPKWETGAFISAGMAGAYLLLSICSQKWLHYSVRCGLRIRSALSLAILYRAISLSSKGAAHPAASVGRIITLAGSDVNQCNFASIYLVFVISLPFQLGVVIFMIQRLLGWIAWVALAITLLFLPLSAMVLRLMAKKREKMTTHTDQRNKMVSELFGAMKIIKSMGLERNFLEAICSVREKELGALREMQVYRVLTSFISSVAPAVVMGVSLMLFSVLGHEMTPVILFPSISLLGILRSFSQSIPYALTITMDLNVSLKRLRTFFTSDTNHPYLEVVVDNNNSNNNNCNDAAKQQQQQKQKSPASQLHPAPPMMIETCNMSALAFEAKDIEAALDRGYGAALKRYEQEQDEGAGCCTTVLCGCCGCCNACCGLACCGRPRFYKMRGCCTLCRGGDKEGEGDDKKNSSSSISADSDKKKKDEKSSSSNNKKDSVQAITAKQVLDNISISIPKGQCTFILGATGSSKTQLVEALLGFSHTVRGDDQHSTVTWKSNTDKSIPTVAYVAQMPWLSNTTIKENILFFGAEQKQLLQKAVDVCELGADLEVLQRGIDTIVGSKGLQLSGGQKSRVALARAVFSDADLYVFDDILAALDATTGENVFKKCILGQLANKTRILITHHVHYAAYANHIIQLDGGRVVFSGDYAEYSAELSSGMIRDLSSETQSFEGSSVIAAAAASSSSSSGLKKALFPASPSAAAAAAALSSDGSSPSSSDNDDHEQSAKKKTPISAATAPLTRTISTMSPREVRERHDAAEKQDLLEEEEKLKKRAANNNNNNNNKMEEYDDEDEATTAATKAVVAAPVVAAAAASASSGGDGGAEEEEISTGAVKREVFVNYFVAAGGASRIVFIILWWIFTECLNQAQVIALTFWAGKAFGLASGTYLYIYLGCVAASFISASSRAWILLETGRVGSRNIHFQLLTSLMCARSSFFDVTPIGRILNRFSADVDTLDNNLPLDLQSLLTVSFSVLSSFAIMIASQPIVILVLIPVMYIYFKVMKLFNSAVLEVKKVDSVNKSPIFASFSEVVDGAKTILSFNKAVPVLRQMSKRIDAYFSSSYSLAIINRWLGVRLELMGNLIVVTVAIIGVFTKTFSHQLALNGDQTSGFIALSLTLAMSMSSSMNWLVRMRAQVESDGNSIDRIFTYSTNVDLEVDVIPEKMVPDNYKEIFRDEVLPGRIARQREVDQKNLAVEREARDKEKKEEEEKKQQQIPAIKSSPPLLSPPLSPNKKNSSSGSSSSSGGASLQLVNVSMRYRPGLPLAVRSVSFEILPGEKVALCGRSGSAKSSLMAIFLRLVDICEDGAMLINGKDCRQMTLPELRGHIALVPQTPSLFEGTLRSNLDPFGECSDAVLEQAIVAVGLEERLLHAAPTQEQQQLQQKKGNKEAGAADSAASVVAMGAAAAGENDDDADDARQEDFFASNEAPATGDAFDKERNEKQRQQQQQSNSTARIIVGRRLPISEALHAPISDGASNMSVGERQQLQLARALTRQAPIVCLDECSASLSHEADATIQRAIRKSFAARTVVTIAHRLTTVAHVDKVIVMDRGRVAEIGHPKQLLMDTQGPFFQLVASQGKKAARQFEKHVVKYHGPLTTTPQE